MIHLVEEITGAVWASGTTIGDTVHVVSDVQGVKFEHFEVSKYDRINMVEKPRRWYFSVYEAEGEFEADDTEKLCASGEFQGYIALVEAELQCD